MSSSIDNSYLVYKDTDIINYDYVYHKGTIEELKKLCDNSPDCIGFNSFGYLKSHIVDSSLLTEIKGCDLYVRKDRIENIVKRTINNLVRRKLDITFVITSCKRLDRFIDTMDSFLFNCTDTHLISKWLVIDDSSSESDIKEMKRRYPFMEVIQKPPERKGHPQSLNLMLNLVKTQYVILFEDDWKCNLKFSVQNYLEFLQKEKYDHVSLLGRHPSYYFKRIGMLHGSDIFEYSFDPTHPDRYGTKLKDVYSMYLKEFGLEESGTWKEKGYYYPGFSLNPGIFNIAKIKSLKLTFNEEAKHHDSFELYFAFQCLKNGWKLCFTNIRILHTGTEKSAYVLNNNPRIFDK